MVDMSPCEADLMPRRIDLSDDAIVGALREMPGYIDVTVGDLREIYRRAYPRAIERSLRGVRAGDLMSAPPQPVHEDLRLVDAARALVEQGVRSLPVVDAEARVIGLFAEADLLRRLNGASALQLLLRLVADPSVVDTTALGLPVSRVMYSAAATVAEDAGYAAIVAAFNQNGGHGVPVVDAAGRMVGILSRVVLAAVADSAL